MKRFLIIFVAVCCLGGPLVAATLDANGNPHYVPKWHQIGADPCRENPNCTPDWALNEAVARGIYPKHVANDFRRQLASGVTPRQGQVCRGERFFMTFGRATLRFVGLMEADFTEVECTPTREWTVYDPVTDRFYRFFQVIACGNWGGQNDLFPTFPDFPTPAEPTDTNTTFSGGSGNVGTGHDHFFGGGGGLIVVNEVTRIIDPHQPKTPWDPTKPVDIAPIPVPGSLGSIALALGMLAGFRKWRQA